MTTQSQTNVAEKITALLRRCDRLKRASTLKPTKFNARGQAHANRIAQADQVPESGTSTRNHQ